MSNEPIPAHGAIIRIKADLAEHGPTPPTTSPGSLDYRQIARRVAVFQPRQLDGRWAEDERHIESLMDAIGKKSARPNYLDPIKVWWGGCRWYVLDGFHRLEAYKRAEVLKALPVRVFEGSLDDAMAHAAACNSKDKLIMRKDDKAAMAWRLVLTTDLSKSKISRSCAVSIGTVNNMRTTRKKLLADPDETPETLLEDGWPSAIKKAKGEEENMPITPPDEKMRLRAEGYQRRLYKGFKDKPHTDPDAFALALMLSNDRLPRALMETDAFEDAFRELVEARKDELDADDLVSAWQEEEDY